MFRKLSQCLLFVTMTFSFAAHAGPVLELPHPCSGTGCTREDIKTDLWAVYPSANMAVQIMSDYKPSQLPDVCDFLKSFSNDLGHATREIEETSPDQKDAASDDLARQLDSLLGELKGFCIQGGAVDAGVPVGYGDAKAAKAKVAAIHQTLDLLWPHFFEML